MACAEREAVYGELETAVAAAMEGYNGEWGFAFHDLQCELMATVQGDHLQYSASSGKIVSAIASIRAVERGDVEIAEVEPHIDEVFSWSSDHDAHMLETFVEDGALAEVLADAGVTEPSYTEGAWNYTFLTPVDMARIWTALVRGELLNEEWTQYLLDKTGLAEIPDGLETFPDARFDLEGFQWGQKAGYYVADGIPYFLVGAGFLVEEDGPEAFIPVVMMRTENAEFLDPQRREVWPLVVDAVVEVTGAPPPADVGPGPWGAGGE